jgi:hypothetical protein
MGFVLSWVLSVIISLYSVNKLICVMVKFGILFEVRTEYLNTIYTSFCFKGLRAGTLFRPLLAQICNLFLTHDTPKFNSGSWEHATKFHLTERGHETMRGPKECGSDVQIIKVILIRIN